MMKQSKFFRFNKDSILVFTFLFAVSGCNEKEIQTSKNLQKNVKESIPESEPPVGSGHSVSAGPSDSAPVAPVSAIPATPGHSVSAGPSNSANPGNPANTPIFRKVGLADLGMANGIRNDSITAYQICHFNSLVKFLSRHPHFSSDSTSKAPINKFYEDPHQDIPAFAKSFHDLIVLNTQKQNIFLKGDDAEKDPKPDYLGSKDLKEEILDFTKEFLAHLKTGKNSSNEELLKFGKQQMFPDDVLSEVDASASMLPLSSLVIAEGGNLMASNSPNPNFFLFSLGDDFGYAPEFGDQLNPVSSIQGIMESHKGYIKYINKNRVSSKQKNYFMISIQRIKAQDTNEDKEKLRPETSRIPFTMDLNLTVQVEREEKSFLLQAAILHYGRDNAGHYIALTVHYDDHNRPFLLRHDDDVMTKIAIDDSQASKDIIEALKRNSTMLLYVEK